jgi:glycerol-3-phosphate dehydrogenase
VSSSGWEAGRLSWESRASALEKLGSETMDLLVVGGGIVGAGIAALAAARGLKVGLVERNDLASGTSSRSSKLVHGGLRYLRMADFGLVREALLERSANLALAPHLVRPQPFLYPLRHRFWERAWVGAGVGLYDLLALGSVGRGLPRHRHLGRRRALEAAPALRVDQVVGAVEYWDAQTDDARLVIALARTAAGLGAEVATGTSFVGVLSSGDRIEGAILSTEEGASLEARARVVVLAAGPWTAEALAAAKAEGALSVVPSKGVHVVVPRDKINSSHALIFDTGRSVFLVLPWGRHWILGTTDTAWPYRPDELVATRADLEYLLGQANQFLSSPLSDADVESFYVGLRPLVAWRSADTAKVSREHATGRPRPGLVVISGGKLTTWRKMAEDVLRTAEVDLGGLPPPRPLRIVGGEGFEEARKDLARQARDAGCSEAEAKRLLGRYGSEWRKIASLCQARPELARPVVPGLELTGAEASFAFSHEGARHLDDALDRRLGLGLERQHVRLAAARAVVELVAPELGWDSARQASELQRYRQLAEDAERFVACPDDASARSLREARASGRS